MKDISSLLGRFANISPPDQFLKEVLIMVISEKTGITLSKDNLDIKGTTVFLATRLPSVKSEILLNKSSILQKVGEVSGKRQIRDIR